MRIEPLRKSGIELGDRLSVFGPSIFGLRPLARDPRTLDAIRSMEAVDRSHADWAFYVTGMTEAAVKVRAPYGISERMPKFARPAPQMRNPYPEVISDSAGDKHATEHDGPRPRVTVRRRHRSPQPNRPRRPN